MCGEKHLGPWEEPLIKPKIPVALKKQFSAKLNAHAAANLIKKTIKKIMHTVSSVTPVEFKARNIQMDTVEATNGKVVGLKKAFSNPKSVTASVKGSSEVLYVKFDVDLATLLVQFHVKSSKTHFNESMQWEFHAGSTAGVRIAIKRTGCSLDFGDTEVQSNFEPKKTSAEMTTLTVKLKCYIHIILEQAVNFVLQILKGVLEETCCQGQIETAQKHMIQT